MSKRRTPLPKAETRSPLETFAVSRHRLIQDARLNAIKHREISIEQDLFSTNEEDELSDVFRLQDNGHSQFSSIQPMDSSPPWRGSLNATRAFALAEVSLAGAATALNFVGGCMKARKIAESGRRLKEELRRRKWGRERGGKPTCV
jgi:hypothetical protein